jgi:SAM-dependent methyltransferase
MLCTVDFEGRTLLRTTFDGVAGDYERVRPTYPEEVFDDLAELAGLVPGARVVEIGCGTGQATLPLARRGFAVAAVELGEELAACTRARLAAFPAVEVVTTSFEDWRPESTGFDAVVSFAAFHWLDPEVRFSKAASLLAEGGALAVFDWEDTLSDEGDDFFVAVEDDYAAVVPEWKTSPPRAPTRIVDWLTADIEDSGAFGPVAARRYVWSVTYRAADYVDFLQTRSGYRYLEDAKRRELFDRIRRRIEARPAQLVRKEFLGLLAIARLVAA